MSNDHQRLADLSAAQKRALLAQRLRQEAARSRTFSLSFAQQRLWFLDQLEPGNATYNLPIAWRLNGHLDIVAYERSLTEIVQRHESLRTTFPARDGQPLQVVASPSPVQLVVVDLQSLPAAARAAEMRHQASADLQRPFDLASGPLWRATLWRLQAAEHLFLLTVHHMVFDGWSAEVFWHELSALYTSFVTGMATALPTLPIQYADYAVWQRQWLQGDVLDGHLHYWQQRLGGQLPTLDLPTDRPRPAKQTFHGAHQERQFSLPLTAQLKALSQQEGVTLFMTLLAAFQVVLYRYSGQTDLLVGTSVAGRSRVETEHLIGFFVNTLVLRTDLGAEPSFRQLLRRVRVEALRAYAHQELPFEKLVEVLQPERDLSHSPLFQVMFVLRSPLPERQLPELKVLPESLPSGTSMFDMTLSMRENAQGLTGVVDYRTDLFDDATITRLLGHLQTVLVSVCNAPQRSLGAMPLLTVAERQQVLTAWNGTATPSLQDLCIHQWFELQVAQSPAAVAVRCGTEQLTYHRLNQRANQLAQYLQGMGVGAEVMVGLCVERCIAMLVGVLGILKAGGAYVPLDPTYPVERLAGMLSESQMPVLVTQQALASRLPVTGAKLLCLDTVWEPDTQEPVTTPRSGVTPAHLAYVIYTSGSTGAPKGVQITHRGICNLAAAQITAFRIRASSRVLQFASLSFDASVSEWAMALCAGATLCLVPPDVVPAGADLAHLLALQHITHVTLPPSVLATLPDATLPALEAIIVAGEACGPGLVAQWSPGRRFYNAYGPTEVTVCATLTTCTDSGHRPPIGRAIANTQVYVLDRQLQPLPIGIPGELYLGGIGLARGYLHSPALTADKFVPHPFSDIPGARLYRTGDWVRLLADGQLDFLGRVDHQVKLHGHRIELEEISTILTQHPAVREAVAVAREDDQGARRLVAYIVPAHDAHCSSQALREFLYTKLPAYMLPAVFVLLDYLPLTPSGKVDRVALPAPDTNRQEPVAAFMAPRTSMEEVLCGIWMAVLGLEHVGIHDNFFALGGHSLLATRVMSRLRQALQVEVPLKFLFESPTLAALASSLQQLQYRQQDITFPPIKPVPRAGSVPLSLTQEKMWALEQVFSGLPLHHIPWAMRLTGMLNLAALEQSFHAIIQRHEALRTTFVVINGQPSQVIASSLHVPLVVEDLRHIPPEVRQTEVRKHRQFDALCPFDLEQGPLLRLRVLRLGEQEHILLVTIHHLIFDGWSMGILRHELAVLYDAFTTGHTPSLPALPIQYADFTFWQHHVRHSAVFARQLAYWQQQLSDPLPVLELPTDHPRPTAFDMTHLLTARQPFALSAEMSASLVRLSRQEGCTLFMTLMAAFMVLLYQSTGQEDIRLGTLAANRNRPETEGVIGFFANTAIIRVNLGGNPTLRAVLQGVRAAILAASTHQELPFEDLVQHLEHARLLQRESLFQVMFISQNAMQQPLALSTLTLDGLSPDYVGITTCDMVVMLSESFQSVTGLCVYKPHIFASDTITQMLSDFQQVLADLVEQPEQRLVMLEAL